MLGHEELFEQISNIGLGSTYWAEKLSGPILVVADRKAD